jgi:hypothetical protein
VEWRRILRILETYEVASGQKINMEKTSIFSVTILAMKNKERFLSYWGFVPLNNITNICGSQL